MSEHGYAVISDVLNDSEVKESKELLWKFIETATNRSVQRDDPQTWSNGWYSIELNGRKVVPRHLLSGPVSVLMVYSVVMALGNRNFSGRFDRI